jgi:hypothetical protein
MQGFRGVSVVSLLLLSLFLCSQRSFAGQPQRLVVIVMTGDGRVVTDLQLKDFTVFDQGSIRPITSFSAFRGGCEFGPAISNVDLARKGENGRRDCPPRYELSFDSVSTIAHEYPQIKIKRPGLKIFVARQRWHLPK